MNNKKKTFKTANGDKYIIINVDSPYTPRVDQLPHNVIEDAVKRFKGFYLKGKSVVKPVCVDYHSDSIFLTVDYRGVHYGQYYSHNANSLLPNKISYPN